MAEQRGCRNFGAYAHAATHAHETLMRGTGFLSAGLAGDVHDGGNAPRNPCRARVLGNGLRELDRFLNVLIDARARTHAVAMPKGQHNTANKLRQLRDALHQPDPDRRRLHALGRSRACLFYCAGIVRRADVPGGGTMTTGWWDRPGEGRVLRQLALGQALHVTPDDLSDVCAFYEQIAGSLKINHRSLYRAG